VLNDSIIKHCLLENVGHYTFSLEIFSRIPHAHFYGWEEAGWHSWDWGRIFQG